MQPAGAIKDYFSVRAFLQAFLLGILLFIILLSVVYMNAEQTVGQIENSLSARNIIIRNLNYESSVSNEVPTTIVKEVFTTGAGSDTRSTESAPSIDDIHKFDNETALYPAPIKGLFETSATGPLPIISANDITPFEAYKKPYSLSGKPAVSVAVMDFGLNEEVSNEILSTLPKNVTLIVSPYANTTREWQKKARDAGFETWLFIPGQNENFLKQDIGSRAIMAEMSYLDNKDVTNEMLSRAAGYAGVVMETDNVLNLANPFANVVITDFFGRGLGFFEINPDAPLTVESLATEANKPYLKNQNFLNEISLRDVEVQAKENSYSIGVIQPYPKSIRALHSWIKTLDAKGIDLAPLSGIKKIKEQIELENVQTRTQEEVKELEETLGSTPEEKPTNVK